MQLHSACRCRKINGCPSEIPDGLLNEEWAQINHSQSLSRLNERGGLTLEEALAIIQKRKFYQLDSPERAIIIYSHIFCGYEAAMKLNQLSEKMQKKLGGHF